MSHQSEIVKHSTLLITSFSNVDLLPVICIVRVMYIYGRRTNSNRAITLIAKSLSFFVKISIMSIIICIEGVVYSLYTIDELFVHNLACI